MGKETILFNLERLQTLIIPPSFSTRKIAGETVEALYQGERTLAKLEREHLGYVKELLAHPELKRLITEGKVTFGIVKPHVEEGKSLPPDDDEAALDILDRIRELGVKDDIKLFSIPLKLTRPRAEEFYEPVKQKIGPNWETYMRFITSGTLTAVLIYRNKTDTIQWWRTMMGATNPQNASAGTIRGDYGRTIRNNIVHGSDSKQS